MDVRRGTKSCRGVVAMAAKKIKQRAEITVRALRTMQGEGLDVFAFFIRGQDILQIADISRLERDEADKVKGFQRPEIRSHVKGIVDYLNQGAVLFPNAIILAMAPRVKFAAARGKTPEGDEGLAQAGTLKIPVFEAGRRVAWIVDGQQRSLALSESNNKDLPVPVVAFVSESIDLQRGQFILVNKVKPLSGRLINELLPETSGVYLPRELSVHKVPAQLCDALNNDAASPFHKLIRRPSDKAKSEAVIVDSAVVKMIRSSVSHPLGALARLKTNGRDSADVSGMYRLLTTFWTAVRDTFPDAWGKDPKQSRLMHSAGISAMGVLMDRIYGRLLGEGNDRKAVMKELEKVAPVCHWTKGRWDSLGLEWNEIESTQTHIRRLQDVLVRAYDDAARR